MPKYIVYKIRAVENLKLAKTNMQIDSHDSMDYISGSALRGAFIYKYMRANNVRDINQGEHREKLLAGGIKFLNAYPLYNGSRSIPLPKAYFAPKEKIKALEDKLDIFLGLDRALPPGYEKIRLCEFVHIDDNRYTKVKVEKVSNLHINKREEKNILFRYEAIKKGQVFGGIIKAEDEAYVNEIISLLKDEVIYVGGSKGSGYGKCIIEDIQVLDENPEGKIFQIKDSKEDIYIIALSDIIYKDELGAYRTKIDEDFLKKALNLENVDFVDSSIETKNITSFNNKWNARTPNIVSIKAGSIFKFRVGKGLDMERIKGLMDQGIGERKAEGYGRIAIATEMDDMVFYDIEEDVEVENKDFTLNDEEKAIINHIGEKIFKLRVKNKINERVLDLDKGLRNTRSLKPSQWGTLKELFESLLFLDIETGKEKFFQYIEHIVKKRSISLKQMNRVEYEVKDEKQVKKQKLIDFLRDYMSMVADREAFEKNYRDCALDIEDMDFEIDEDFIYRTNLKVIAELCRYQIRKGDLR